MNPRGLRIGLTGGIGSGKSRAAEAWAALGAQRLDADAVARSLTAPGGAALADLQAAFGPDILAADGGLDRAAMRARAFADPAVRLRLEALLHPRIGAALRAALDAATGPVQVVEIPLLVEQHARWRPLLDRILVIDCPVERQIERTMARSGWPRAQVEAVIAQQASRAARLDVADAVIDNARDDPAALDAAVRALWARWLGTSPPGEGAHAPG
ncbi:dephospho-CoA kinase [Piscinibacter sp. Jin2]|uniref:Dephospho-CoA kinase n=1 Tax=Aquariibacter lacus TaxID=2801332 RepID=A0A9X0XDW6_9BURK|nr:dephospho-CoA kinase [Piscinibacter lacus]MBL0719156.1 dephospho-CoA kinase [Piscinibacter lacus]